jgi:gas vesicle protein
MSGFGLGMLTGVIVGGVIALLYAPKSGKETRALIEEKAVEVRHVVGEKLGDVQHAVGEKLVDVKHTVGDKVVDVRHAVGEKIAGEERVRAGKES